MNCNRPCTLCKKRFTAIRDLGVQRAVLLMDVYCLHRPKGCEWQGEEKLLYKHLTGSVDSGCPYMLVECPLNCGLEYLCSKVESHVQSQCPKRMMTCQFCNHLFMWQELIKRHCNVCPKEPVVCPNGCECAPI